MTQQGEWTCVGMPLSQMCTNIDSLCSAVLTRRVSGSNALIGYGMTQPKIPGIDVGSTTVKPVVVDATGREILWSDSQRHET